MAKTKTRNRIYTFVIKGLYAAQVEDRQESKPFEMTFKCPESRLEEGPLSLFCKDHAPEFMPRKYPDYIRLVTHEIVESSVDGEPVDDIRVMNRVDLEQYVKENELPVLVEIYTDCDSLRQAVMDCEEDEAAFVAKQDKHGKRKLDEIKRKRELAELNSDADLEPAVPKKGGRPPKQPVTDVV